MSIVSPSLMEVILRYKLLQFVKMLSLQTLHTHFSRMVYRKGHIYQHINVIHPQAIKNFIFSKSNEMQTRAPIKAIFNKINLILHFDAICTHFQELIKLFGWESPIIKKQNLSN